MTGSGEATRRPHIVIDIPARFERELFDDADLRRLESVGRVTRTGGAGGDVRLDADILISGWDTPRLPDHRADSGRLRFVAHTAGTIRPIVPRSLMEEGVLVSQAAAAMATSVAELALYFTLSLMRSLHRVDRIMHVEHDWTAAASFGLGHTVGGAAIGVVGASRVGREYIRLLTGFGARISVYDPYLDAADAVRMGVERKALDELLADSRVVAIHAPVTAETRGLITAERLAMIRDGGALVNTARSAVMDTEALERELRSGRLSAALDVFDREPLDESSPLWGLPNVLLSPHLGAVTWESRRAQGDIALQEVVRFAQGRPLEFEVPVRDYERLA